MNKLDLSQVPYELLVKEIKERCNTFYDRLNLVNNIIDEMLKSNCPIVDADNADYRLEKLVYDKDIDELFFKTVER